MHYCILFLFLSVQAQFQIPLFLEESTVAVKMLKLNNTCRFIDIYDTQRHVGVQDGGIATNIYAATSKEEAQVFEFIGADRHAVLEFVLNKYSDCRWDSAFHEFTLDVEQTKVPEKYEIVYCIN